MNWLASTRVQDNDGGGSGGARSAVSLHCNEGLIDRNGR
jgi:hypothetical protein